MTSSQQYDVKKEALLKQIRAVEAKKIQLSRAEQNKIAEFFLKHFPFLIALIDKVTKTSLSTDKFIAFYHSTKGLTQAVQGLQVTAFILAGLELITLPITFLSCKILGKRFPFTLSMGAKWFYSGALLTLGVLAFTIPVIAFPIGVAASALVLATSVFTLGKFLISRRKTNKHLARVNEAIHKLEVELERINALANTPQAFDKDIETLTALLAEKNALTAKYEQLQHEKLALSEKQTMLNRTALTDKVVALAITTVGIAGGIVALFAPPVGLGLVLFASISALAFITTRAVLTIFRRRKKTSHIETQTASVIADDNINSQNKATFIHESTLDIANRLSSDSSLDLISLIKAMHEESELADKINRRIHQIIILENRTLAHQYAIDFLLHLGQELMSPEHNIDDVQSFIASIDDFDKAIPIFRQALTKVMNQEIKLSRAQLESLKHIPQVRQFIEGKKDQLHTLYLTSAKKILTPLNEEQDLIQENTFQEKH